MLKTLNLKSAVVALALGGLLAAPAIAGTETNDGKASKNVIEETKKSCLTGDLGINIVSEYISRGLVYENQGVIAQPYADIFFKVYSGDGFVNSVVLQLGVWSSLHTHDSGFSANSSVKNWFEFDYTAAIATTFLKNYTATFSYIEADYPGVGSQYALPNRNLQLGLSMNDSDYLGAFALHPHFNVLYNLDVNGNDYTKGAAGTSPGGWYFELGVAPGYTFIKESPYAITVTLPVTLGLGDHTFYALTPTHTNVFGYFSTGINVSVPLAFIPSCFGAWTANTGFTYYRLGNTAAEYSQNIGVTGGSQDQYVFSGGVGMTW